MLLNPFVALRPTHRGLVERLGRYDRFYQPGFHIRIPIVDRLFIIYMKLVLFV